MNRDVDRPPISLRRRLTIGAGLAGAIAAVAAAGLLAWTAQRQMGELITGRAAATVAAAAVLADHARTGGRSFAVLDQLRARLPWVESISVVSTDGRAMWPPGGAAPATVGSAVARELVPGVGEVFVTYAALAPGTWRTVALVAALPFVVLACVLLALGASLRRHVTRPLAALDSAITRALAGDFVRRISLPGPSPVAEIDALLADTNRLMAKITDLSVRAIDTGRELDETRRELQLKDALAEQKRVAEAANRLLEARVRELALLFEVSRVIATNTDVADILGQIAELVGNRLGLHEISLMVLDDTRALLTVLALHGFEDAVGAGRTVLRVEDGVAGLAVRSGEAQIVNDVATDARWRGERPAAGSLLCIPLRRAGEVVGVVNFGRRTTGAFRPEDILYLSAVADLCVPAVAASRLHPATPARAGPDAGQRDQNLNSTPAPK